MTYKGNDVNMLEYKEEIEKIRKFWYVIFLAYSIYFLKNIINLL